MNSIEQMAEHMASIKATVERMVDARRHANHLEGERAKAIAYHDNEIWPLPKYRELLFIR